MKALKKFVVNHIPHQWALPAYLKLRKELIVLSYHLVSDEKVRYVHYPYRTVSNFERDIDFFVKHYNLVTGKQLLASIEGGPALPPRALLLTFDDGHAECETKVAPILKSKGVPAVFFLTTSLLDNQNIHYRHLASLLAWEVQKLSPQASTELDTSIFMDTVGETLRQKVMNVGYAEKARLFTLADCIGFDWMDFLKQRKPYLTSSQVRSLQSAGFEIGGHSVDHPRFTDVSVDEQVRQTVDCMKALKTQYGCDDGFFAFPSSDAGVSLDYFDRVYNSGSVKLTFGTHGIFFTDLKRNIQRAAIEDQSVRVEQSMGFLYNINLVRRILNKTNVERYRVD